MKRIVIASASLAMMVGIATADTCKDQAASKKLAGAALTSFMNKCKKDADATCNSQATDKKLAGAAKTSFVKKCVTDTVGQ